MASKMKQRTRRLPSGNYTSNLKYYLRAWKQVARPIIKKTGWRLMAFDPGFLFVDNNNQTVSMTTHQIKDLTAHT